MSNSTLAIADSSKRSYLTPCVGITFSRHCAFASQICALLITNLTWSYYFAIAKLIKDSATMCIVSVNRVAMCTFSNFPNVDLSRWACFTWVRQINANAKSMMFLSALMYLLLQLYSQGIWFTKNLLIHTHPSIPLTIALMQLIFLS